MCVLVSMDRGGDMDVCRVGRVVVLSGAVTRKRVLSDGNECCVGEK